VLEFIERVQAEDAGLDAPALAERITHHFGYSVHRRTVERALAREKKNADARADPPRLGPDGQSLAAHYEALRPAVIRACALAPC